MANKRVGLADFAGANAAPATTADDSLKRKRGQGETVALTVRLTRAKWERMHSFALQEGMSLQELAVDAIAEKFAKRGLEF